MDPVPFRGQLASAYRPARHLPDATLTTWMRAAARHLTDITGPILDLGAGSGRFSLSLATHFEVPVVAVELSADMRLAAATIRRRRVHVVGGRAEAIPCAGNIFQAIWLSQVIHHLSDVDRCAAELRRVLLRGGRILVRGGFDDVARIPPLHRYFPALRGLAGDGADALARLRTALSEVGIEPRAHDVIEQVSAPSLRAYHDQAALRGRSPLQRLTDAEFAAGLAQLGAAADRETTPTPVIDHVDLVIFG